MPGTNSVNAKKNIRYEMTHQNLHGGGKTKKQRLRSIAWNTNIVLSSSKNICYCDYFYGAIPTHTSLGSTLLHVALVRKYIVLLWQKYMWRTRDTMTVANVSFPANNVQLTAIFLDFDHMNSKSRSYFQLSNAMSAAMLILARRRKSRRCVWLFF